MANAEGRTIGQVLFDDAGTGRSRQSTFKAAPPALLRRVRVGQVVGLDVRIRGMDAEVTALWPH